MSKNPIIKLFSHSKKQVGGVFAYLSLAALSGLTKTVIALSMGKVVDSFVAKNYNDVYEFTFIAILFIVLDSLRTAAVFKIGGKTIEKIFLNFREAIFNKIAKCNAGKLESTFGTGELLLRLSSNLEQLSVNLFGRMQDITRILSQAIFALVACFFINPILSLCYFLILPFSLYFIKKLSDPTQKQMRVALNAVSKSTNIAAEAIKGVLTIKAYNLENKITENFVSGLNKSYEENVKTQKINLTLSAVKFGTTIFQLIILIGLGYFLVKNGVIQIGMLLSFITLVAYVNQAFGSIDNYINTYRTTSNLSEHLCEVFDLEEENDTQSANELQKTETILEINDLTYGYNEEVKVLKNIYLKVKKGQKVCLIGESGSGKSTILNLICKFYEDTSGSIKIFDEKINNLCTTDLHSKLSIVSQNNHLFSGTIFENISYGKGVAECPEEEIWKVLDKVNLKDFVLELPKKLNTIIKENATNLSGGQKQRFCIARAMIKNADLTLLDEATSALDTKTEEEVQKAIDELIANKSALIVTHKLKSSLNADYIYCIKDGEIIEEGMPTELLATNSYYTQTLKKQMQLEEEAE
jgi:ABC-type multidrug transport system fused ATPase/permease subunit